MGTDIHVVWQVRKNGAWIMVKNPTNKDGHFVLFRRDYDAFSLLAGVRTGIIPYTPIAQGRGLPADFMPGIHADDDDIASEYQKQFAKAAFEKAGIDPPEDEVAFWDLPLDLTIGFSDWLGEHSFSWCSLTDLAIYDWNQSYPLSGYVSEVDYMSWKLHGGCPCYWFDYPYGTRLCMSMDEYDAALRGKRLDPGEAYLIAVHWDHSAEYNKVYTELFPAMEELRREHDVNGQDVRIVFGFDS